MSWRSHSVHRRPVNVHRPPRDGRPMQAGSAHPEAPKPSHSETPDTPDTLALTRRMSSWRKGTVSRLPVRCRARPRHRRLAPISLPEQGKARTARQCSNHIPCKIQARVNAECLSFPKSDRPSRIQRCNSNCRRRRTTILHL